jgi:hypothetical protein
VHADHLEWLDRGLPDLILNLDGGRRVVHHDEFNVEGAGIATLSGGVGRQLSGDRPAVAAAPAESGADVRLVVEAALLV